MGLPDPSASRVVLIGASRYSDASLADLPAVANNLRKLSELFRDPDLWGLPQSNIVTVLNPASRDEALEALHEAARAATDAIAVYFAGHGLLDRLNSSLYLALPKASYKDLHRAILYDDLRRAITASTCRAQSKVVILDCCYSGAAMDGYMSAALNLADQARIEGTYLMTASAENKLALAAPGETYTAFTAELVRTIELGVSESSDLLDMGTLYLETRARLLAQGRTEPQERARNNGRSIALVRNRRGQATVILGSGGRTGEDLASAPPESREPVADTAAAAKTSRKRRYGFPPRQGEGATRARVTSPSRWRRSRSAAIGLTLLGMVGAGAWYVAGSASRPHAPFAGQRALGSSASPAAGPASAPALSTAGMKAVFISPTSNPVAWNVPVVVRLTDPPSAGHGAVWLFIKLLSYDNGAAMAQPKYLFTTKTALENDPSYSDGVWSGSVQVGSGCTSKASAELLVVLVDAAQAGAEAKAALAAQAPVYDAGTSLPSNSTVLAHALIHRDGETCGSP
jgi:hypothetical protein